MSRHVDAAQQEVLDRIKDSFDKGELKQVRDTPDYWKKYTEIELDFILKLSKPKKHR